MKTKYVLLLAALCAVCFSSCEKNEPFDTQSEDDAPIFLKPFETEDGKVYGKAKNPDPYVDSVLVTPSAYTTVNWYVDDQLVHTGLKIEECFPTGTYDLLIEAVTTAGKRTTRSGVLTVEPAADDPYAAASSGTHHLAPGVEMTISGKNLDKVTKVVLASDLYGNDIICTVSPNAKAAASLKLVLPAVEVGVYYLFLQGEDDVLYGSDKVEVHSSPLVLNRFTYFAPNDPWTIRGVKLQNAVSVRIGDVEITDIQATASDITFTAPNLEYGEYMLSIKNEDGSPVMFSTDNGLLSEVQTECGPERMLWEGPAGLDWEAEHIKVTKEQMAKVQLGDSLIFYLEWTPADYHCIRINTPAWGDEDSWEANLLPQVNVTEEMKQIKFVYDERCKNLVEQNDAMCTVGFGATLDRIMFKKP